MKEHADFPELYRRMGALQDFCETSKIAEIFTIAAELNDVQAKLAPSRATTTPNVLIAK